MLALGGPSLALLVLMFTFPGVATASYDGKSANGSDEAERLDEADEAAFETKIGRGRLNA